MGGKCILNEQAMNLICTSEDLWNTIAIHEWLTDESDIDWVIYSLEELKNGFIKYKNDYSYKY